MKPRYTSLQTDVGAAGAAPTSITIDGMPVVAAALHSQVPAIAVAFKQARPDGRLAYVMTDGGALPIALSDLVAELRDRGLVDATVTCGHAFGGDYEAVSVYGALAIARRDVARRRRGRRDGTGHRRHRRAGSGSAVSRSARCSTRRAALAGLPIAALRVSFADPRPRHRGVSHHSLTALTIATRSRVLVPVPCVGGDEEAQIRRDLARDGHRHPPRARRRRTGRRRAALAERRPARRVDGLRPRPRSGAVRGRGRGGVLARALP